VSLEDRTVIIDFQFKAIVEAANTLFKLTTIYFVVIGASLGYVFSTSLAKSVVIWLIYGLLGISTFYLIVCLALSYGVVKGLVDIRHGLAALEPHVAEETNIVNFMKRGGRVSVLAAFCCVAIVTIIAGGLSAILWQKLYL
jgi:hypothetical protein